MLRLAAALFLAFVTLPAFAASSVPATTEGGDVRLIVESGGVRDGGVIRGAIEVALKPGWKTYWRDPGDAGIPPTIEVAPESGIAAATILFPPPRRFDDGVSVWAGYDRPVALPVLFRLAPGADPRTIAAHVFLGVCEEICIPVDARFSVDLEDDAGTDDALVEAAFAALPGKASETDASVSLDGTRVTVTLAKPPAGPDAALFVAAPPGWTFSTPKAAADDPARFGFDILFKPKGQAVAGQSVSYTLVDGDRSFEGGVTLP